jgi:signal transduction histidine kinase
MVEEFGRREGMVATFHRVNTPGELPSDVAVALYRIAQEALRNVAKHAGRTHVKVFLEGTERDVRLTIRDLGQGFDTDGAEIRGLGLVSMDERARLIGGSFSIQSTLGEGTSVTVTAPVPAESNAPDVEHEP